MSSQEIASEIPHIRLVEAKLLSLYYRVAPELVTDGKSEAPEEGSNSIDLSFRAKRKNSFKLRVRQQLKAGGVSFRTTHEMRFATQSPIPKELFGNEVFQRNVVNIVLPFSSELFANLSGKSFVAPIVIPSKIPAKTEEES